MTASGPASFICLFYLLDPNFVLSFWLCILMSEYRETWITLRRALRQAQDRLDVNDFCKRQTKGSSTLSSQLKMSVFF